MKKLLLSLLGVAGTFATANAQLWTPVNSNMDTVSGIRYMSAVDTNTVWAIGYDGTEPSRCYIKFTRTIDGNTFTSGTFEPDTMNYSPSNICAVNDTMAFIATYFKDGTGTPGQILKTVDGGVTWNNVATANMFNSSANFPNIVHFWDVNNGWCMGDPNNTFGSGNEFEIWRTMDGGTNWTRVPGANIPAPQSGEYGTTDVYAVNGDHRIWYGTNKGRVFYSADTGATWAVTALTGMAGGVYGLAFRDSVHGMAWGAATTAATPAIVFKVTSNGGVTWTTLNTATTGTNIGWTGVDNVPGMNAYMTVGLNVPRSQYVTSVTYDDGISWYLLESGTTNTERIIELEVLDSTHAWGGNFSDNTLPYGFGGMDKYAGPNLMLAVGLRPVVAEDLRNLVYPNPSSGVVNMRLQKAPIGTQIRVTDLMGKEVYSTVLTTDYINMDFKMDLSGNAKGVYMVQVINGKNSDVKKLVIQ